MAVGRFLAMVGVLVWRQTDGKYLLLQRSAAKDFAAGEWECVTGRLEQGESFVQAGPREAFEELGLDVHVEFILGTTPSSAATSRSRNVSPTVRSRERSVAGRRRPPPTPTDAVPAGLDGRALEVCLPPARPTSPTAMRGTVKVG